MYRCHSYARATVPALAIAGVLLAASTCDINNSGAVNAADVQAIVNEALGAASPIHDLNGDGVVNVADVEIALNAVFVGVCASDFSPQIAFYPLPSQLLGIPPFPISAKSSSGKTSFASATLGVCAIADDLVTLLHAGTCSITASQAGIASTGTRSFAVRLAQPAGALHAATGSPVAVGTNPNSIASGDFNGDGILDLAVANEMSSNVTVLLGDGSGGFTPASNSPIAVAGSPVAVAIGDFDGDGHQDLALGNLNGNNIAVLLGNGSGGFTPASGSPFAAGTNPDFVAIGDFNSDGIEDLAVSNLNSNNVTVLLGNGSGGFAAAPGSPFAAGSNPQAVSVGDFNHDGKLDLATPNYSGSVTILLGNGAGGFAEAQGSPFATGGVASSLAVGDYNGDGKEDLAVGTYDTNSVAVFVGNGSGGFAPAVRSPFSTGTGRAALAVADFNGDGIQDLVVANANSNNVTVLLGDGSGAFTSMSGSPFPAGTEPVCVAVGDFNRDGIEDIAIVNLISNNVTVLLGSAH